MACRYCGQIKPVRHGVEMTAIQVRLFDAVARAGDDGIGQDELLGIIAEDLKRPLVGTLRVHVHNINEMFADQGVPVRLRGRSGHRGGYRLVEIEKSAA